LTSPLTHPRGSRCPTSFSPYTFRSRTTILTSL